jgi:hypothetical protein
MSTSKEWLGEATRQEGKTMKRLHALAIAPILGASFVVACGGDDEADGEDGATGGSAGAAGGHGGATGGSGGATGGSGGATGGSGGATGGSAGEAGGPGGATGGSGGETGGSGGGSGGTAGTGGSVNPPACTKTVESGSSIQTVVDSAEPGDVICVRAGTYSEQVILGNSGTAEAPILLMAHPGETPIIDRQYEGGQWEPALGLYGDYTHVDGLEVRRSRGYGVEMLGQHTKASHMNVHHNGETGVIAQGDFSIVEDSTVWWNASRNCREAASEDCPGDSSASSGWASGLSAARDKVDGITDNAILRRNVVFNNWGEGLSSFEAQGTIMEDNVVYDNWATNTYISDSSNVLFQRNIVYNPPTSAMTDRWSTAALSVADEVSSVPRSKNNTIINNMFLGGGVGLFSWTEVDGSGLDNVLFAYNTLVDAELSTGPENSGSLIQNNILSSASIETEEGLTLSNNLWLSSAASNGSGAGDVIGDPLLAKTGSTEGGQLTADYFKLSAVSPAIDQGTSLSAVTSDYFNMPRGSSPDIGAHEYVQ